MSQDIKETFEKYLVLASKFDLGFNTNTVLNGLSKRLVKLYWKPYIVFEANDDILKEIEPIFTRKGYFVGKFIYNYTPITADDIYTETKNSYQESYKYYLTYKEENIPTDAIRPSE